jgi:hypothetical protein
MLRQAVVLDQLSTKRRFGAIFDVALLRRWFQPSCGLGRNRNLPIVAQQ